METDSVMNAETLDARFRDAVRQFWSARAAQQSKQVDAGRIDAGTRGAVTGGTQMGALEVLVADILADAGLDKLHIRTRTALELPGYFRPEKKWDLLVVADGQLVVAMEFKSQVGPSFGNNFNNRTEEALGSAVDIWTAYREGRLGKQAPRPVLGYFFLLEDCAEVRRPVRNAEPYFPVAPEFKGASYSKRYEFLIRRMVLERLYDAACLTLATKGDDPQISHPADDLTFRRFAAALQGAAYAFAQSKA
ncbi:MAG: PaeR7I family type II restriction endonuclease [Armatimonadota bacterium]|nr:PaeR7I family type II restriction endonuclease [Armatimonadota bacterium]